jgi:hypothetical protein
LVRAAVAAVVDEQMKHVASAATVPSDGMAGVDGTPGARGPSGPTGPAGERGADGAALATAALLRARIDGLTSDAVDAQQRADAQQATIDAQSRVLASVMHRLDALALAVAATTSQ